MTRFRSSYRIEEKSGQELPEPPAAIRDWLEAHDHRHGIAWWHETRWPWPKLRAHRREIFGYVIWRRTPLPLRAAPCGLAGVGSLGKGRGEWRKAITLGGHEFRKRARLLGMWSEKHPKSDRKNGVEGKSVSV